MLKMTNENLKRLFNGLTIAVGIARTEYFCTSFSRRRSGRYTTHTALETMNPTGRP
jgi:hypothetical protein